jgi:hypothetical protein
MKTAIFFNILFLMGCQALPQLYQAAEDIADDTAIKIEVSKETFQKDTDLQININVQNKEEPVVNTTKEKL